MKLLVFNIVDGKNKVGRSHRDTESGLETLKFDAELGYKS